EERPNGAQEGRGGVTAVGAGPAGSAPHASAVGWLALYRRKDRDVVVRQRGVGGDCARHRCLRHLASAAPPPTPTAACAEQCQENRRDNSQVHSLLPGSTTGKNIGVTGPRGGFL